MNPHDLSSVRRALRRHHRARLLAKRRHHFGRMLSPAEAARAVATPTPCSCWMCGNPRRYTGERTIAERREEGRSVGSD